MKQSMPDISLDGALAWLKENMLLVLTFSGVVSGFVLGLGLRPLELEEDTIHLLSYPGELFMRLLKLMILPLVIASLITGAASLNAKMNGMIALRTIVFFMVTSLLAACVGLVLVIAIHPGTPEIKAVVGSGNQQERKIEILDNFLDLGRNVIPDNLFMATFQTAGTKYEEELQGNSTDYRKVLAYRSGTNTLGIIFFCLTFGTVLGSIGRKAEPVINFFKIIDEVIMKMVNGIMWISPVGISSVICAKILGVANLGR
jgi:Na+/H+-dicarboxylate symporter